jgi:uncharacterized protein (DUF697 family)
MDPTMIRSYFEIAFQVIGFASAVAAVVPIPQAVAPLIIARKVLDIFAMNLGYSKNAKS